MGTYKVYIKLYPQGTQKIETKNMVRKMSPKCIQEVPERYPKNGNLVNIKLYPEGTQKLKLRKLERKMYPKSTQLQL